MNGAYKQRVERLVLAVLLLLVFSMAARTPLDSDLWWHLRAGQETLRSGQPVLVDSFSYTRAGTAWVNHSWLAQVGLYSIYRAGGSLALSALVAGLAVLGMYWLFLALEGHALVRAFIVILASVVAAPVWTARPQMASFVLLSLTGFILSQYRWKAVNRLWLLPPIFILWSNLHGGYVLGLIWIGLEIAGRLLDLLMRRSTDASNTARQAGILALVGIGCGLSVLVNPNGLDTWLIPFQTVGVETLRQMISEWASPDFHQITQLPFLAFLLLACISIGLSTRRLEGTDFLLLTGFACLALYARRNFGPFALAAAIVTSRHIGPAAVWIWQRIRPTLTGFFSGSRFDWSKYQPQSGKSMAGANWINAILIILLGLTALAKWLSVSTPGVVADFERQLYPAAAVEWVVENEPGGRLFNSYDWGGYLIWKLQAYPVFVDGRTDLFNDEILNQWLQVVNGEPGWEDTLAGWNAHLVFIEPTWPVNGLLVQTGWTILYQDSLAVIYGK